MPHRRALPLVALLAGVALAASACSLTGLSGRVGEDRAGPPAHAHRAPRKPGPTVATAAPVRVVMNDRFRYRPSSIIVRAGRRVTFAVTNAGKLPHEFILGDRATQLDHESQMQAMPAGEPMDMDMDAHTHGTADEPMAHHTHGAGLTVPPGQTRRLTWTFHDPGVVLYGCHVLGHWAAGMRGTILVVSPRPAPAPVSRPRMSPTRAAPPPLGDRRTRPGRR